MHRLIQRSLNINPNREHLKNEIYGQKDEYNAKQTEQEAALLSIFCPAMRGGGRVARRMDTGPACVQLHV